MSFNNIYLICLLITFVKFGLQQDFDQIEYAVEMDMDDLEANLDLSAYGVQVVRKVSALGNVYHLRHVPSCNNERCKRDTSDMVFDILQNHPMIRRVEEQEELEVEQKFIESDSEYFFDDHDLNLELQNKILESVDTDFGRDLDEDMDIEKKKNFVKSDLKEIPQDLINQNSGDNNKKPLTEDDVEYLKLVAERENNLRGLHFNDPETQNLWQYHNSGQFQQVNPGFDMNIFTAYKANVTGRGVVITVIDDGIDTRCKEIQKNFDASASLDLNDPHNTASDPRGPAYIKKVPYKDGHGTLCASTIAGEINNEFCAFGIAHNANLGGIRMLAESMVTDLLEAYALTHNNQYIDIYSNSWGPKDTGAKTSPVTYYAKKAFEFGATKGRSGKGSIYLFAAGNGGIKGDHCGADGLVNSPYTIAVTALNIYGHKPSYTEECSAISIAAPVGGYSDTFGEQEHIDPHLVSAHINNKCKRSFMGTSAATPLVAGCVALGLEANPNLNWRDVQYLFALSGRIPNPVHYVWQLNTAGFLISHVYGFGILDCTAYVRNAQMWRSVGPLHVCVGGSFNQTKDLKIRSQRKTRITFQTSACENTEKAIDRLEHVIIHTKIQHSCRGDLTITLTSPTNTRSFLLKSRSNDKENKTVSFSFLSLMNWGENPKGRWYFDIADAGLCLDPKDSEERGHLLEVVLEFHGTKETDSGVYKNRKIIENYLKKINIEKPEQSKILNQNEISHYYQNQRKYFIKLETLKREVIEYKQKIYYAKSSEEINSLNEKFIQLKNKIPEDEMNFLNNLLYDKKHNTL